MEKEKFYLLVAGSRNFGPNNRFKFSNEYLTTNLICETVCSAMLKKQIELDREIHIVHGDARGADTVGKIYGIKKGYEINAFPANWGMFGRAAGHIRNAEMYQFLRDQEHKGALLFWDGESKGTKNNFYQAYRYRVPIKCFLYLQERFMTEEEIRATYEECLEEMQRQR